MLIQHFTWMVMLQPGHSIFTESSSCAAPLLPAWMAGIMSKQLSTAMPGWGQSLTPNREFWHILQWTNGHCFYSSDGSYAVVRGQHCKEMSAKPVEKNLKRKKAKNWPLAKLGLISQAPMVKSRPHGVRGWWGATCCLLACTMGGPEQRDAL